LILGLFKGNFQLSGLCTVEWWDGLWTTNWKRGARKLPYHI